MIAALLQKIDLDEEKIVEEYDKFYAKYPGGEINEQQFLQMSTVMGKESIYLIFIGDVLHRLV